MDKGQSAIAAARPDSWGVLPPQQVCEQARKSRDPRFDGLFFIGVLTTGIYCRTICPARMPAESNVRYFPTGAAAAAAGFRPCLRCRPEAALPLPEWTLGSDTVVRALRLIEAGFLNNHSTGDLAQSLEIGERQLSRLFSAQLGASPKAVGRMCRAKVARTLLRQGRYTHTEIAYHAGFGSVSRFNAEMREIFQATPTQLRAAGKKKRAVKTSEARPTNLTFTLPVRKPYHFDWIFGYLQNRQLPGWEEVTGSSIDGDWCYRRRVGETHENEWVEVRPAQDSLEVRLPLVETPVHELLHRVRMVFDLNADGHTLCEFLSEIDLIKPLVKEAPGLRVAGAWDGFETSVRAILGQQVSVARGTELANKMMTAYGDGRFPSPKQLLGREVAELGMPGRRGRAIVHLAEQVVAGDLQVDECQDYQTLVDRLTSLDGIGPWTANYIRMRVLKDPNAFPDNDWVVLKELGCTAAQARKQSQTWQPWRAYVLMYLWYSAGKRRATKQTRTNN
ncbi:MAG: Ada metal-binding domain-containing protein [Pseudomonadota bacterium]